jgi:hypothetical protein
VGGAGAAARVDEVSPLRRDNSAAKLGGDAGGAVGFSSLAEGA